MSSSDERAPILEEEVIEEEIVTRGMNF